MLKQMQANIQMQSRYLFYFVMVWGKYTATKSYKHSQYIHARKEESIWEGTLPQFYY